MISRRSVTPILLVVLAAGTAAYALLVDRDRISDADRTARRADVFPSFRREDVTRVAILHRGEAVVLERANDAGSSAWRLTTPPLGDADAPAVDILLRALESAPRIRTVDPRDAPGLDAPRASGTVSMGAVTYRFELGADAPLPPGAAYLRVAGEGTFVVPPSMAEELEKGADAYRGRRLVPCDAKEITRVTLGPVDPVVIERHGPSFRMVPGGVRASREASDRLLGELVESRAESFLDDGAADRALVPTLAAAIETGERGPAIDLRLGGDCPGHVGQIVLVRTRPTRLSACVDTRHLAALAADRAALADDSPFFAHPDEIEEVRVERPGTTTPTLDVARRGPGWRQRSPADRDLSADEALPVTDLLAALADTHGALTAAGDAGTFQARTRVTVVRTGGETTESIELAAPDADRSTLLRRADDDALLRLSPDQAARLASILRVM